MSTSMASSSSAAGISSQYRKRARKFASLNPDTSDNGSTKLQGIVFDVDGTLCLPQNYMFGEMREALGISKSTDILEHVYSLPPAEQEEAKEKVRVIERRAMQHQTPQPGLDTLMEYLDKRKMRKAICTRNFDIPINHLLENFLSYTLFSPIITRSFKPAKPHPAGILHIAKEWSLSDGAEDLVMVGDSIDDMKAGRAAGALTVLLVNKENEALKDKEETDVCIDNLAELAQLLEKGLACTAA